VTAVMQDFLAQGWMEHNTRPAKVMQLNHPGFVTELDLMTERETVELPMFKEFLRPRGCFATAGTLVHGLDNDKMILSIEGFGSHDEARAAVPQLDALRPHLARATQIASQFRLQRMKSYVEALEAIGAAACVVATTGSVRIANARFESELGSTIFDTRARLRVADPRADQLLEGALGEIRKGGGEGRSIPIKLGANRSRVIHLVPIKGHANELFVNAMALLVVTNPSAPMCVSFQVIQDLFDLTAAEAKLTKHICERDASLPKIADELGISLNTAKTQIQAVFRKTGTKRQVDLVKLLMSTSKF
jgi:DNA-binding CsgD family transcriptional regulator